jgi:hypothetical protein
MKCRFTNCTYVPLKVKFYHFEIFPTAALNFIIDRLIFKISAEDTAETKVENTI